MIKVVVPISGGKDSQAALRLALQKPPVEEVRGLFCDTNFEHQITYKHVNDLRDMYGDISIDIVSGGSVLEKSVKYGRFPGGGARHCTDELKIRMTRIYCKALAEKQGGFEVWYGMRLQESPERKKRYSGKVNNEPYAPHEVMPSKYPKYLQKLGVMFKLPILDWSESDVMDFLEGKENPLYAAGFPRVGCFPCLASGDKWKERAYAFDDFGAEQKKKVFAISKLIGKPMFNSKGGQARNIEFTGCQICAI